MLNSDFDKIFFVKLHNKTVDIIKAAYSVTMNIFRKKNIFFLNHL